MKRRTIVCIDGFIHYNEVFRDATYASCKWLDLEGFFRRLRAGNDDLQWPMWRSAPGWSTTPPAVHATG